MIELIRLSDASIREYEAARSKLLESIGPPRSLSSLFVAIGHFENCINSTRRAIRMIDRLKRSQSAPGLDRSKRKAIEQAASAIVSIRNVVEHVDEMVHRGELVQGDLGILYLNHAGDGLAIASVTLTFDQLSGVITQLNAVASDLAKYRVP